MSQYAILLFAAGLGTRMGPLVLDRPKPLVPVAGKPLIDHALDLTDVPQIGTRVVNVHYKGDMLRDHLSSRNITFSDESNRLLETGGGLAQARPLLGSGPVLTLNTDAVWHGPNPITALLAAWRDHMEALMLMVPRSHAFGHKGNGDFIIGPDGRMQRGPGDVYTGLQMIRTERLSDIHETAFSMNVFWNQINARGGLFGARYSGQWCDVGHPGAISLAEDMLKGTHDV